MTESGPKHDADCQRRRDRIPFLCTCGLQDQQVAAAIARALAVLGTSREQDS